ncbi:Kinase phosphorylation domain [Forsythia ovata]|uniref:Kinase phosphorylation domain n=1 Tax=Forsythia ovata TaxID=205694 RepID=A0ABD1WH34_9LAMI
MYHPSRGGVRGGRDQFSWEDVKADKHRENYLGHSLKAPVGRWQKGKDLNWYARDKKSDATNSEAIKEEIRRIKEEEEQAMSEALGLAPKRAKKSQGNRLDKHEFAELVKRGSTAEDLGAGHAEAAQVQGLGLSRVPRPGEESSLPASLESESFEKMNTPMPITPARNDEEEPEDESSRKKRKREEKKREKHEKREKRHSRSSDEKRKHNKEKEKRRHNSD